MAKASPLKKSEKSKKSAPAAKKKSTPPAKPSPTAVKASAAKGSVSKKAQVVKAAKVLKNPKIAAPAPTSATKAPVKVSSAKASPSSAKESAVDSTKKLHAVVAASKATHPTAGTPKASVSKKAQGNASKVIAPAPEEEEGRGGIQTEFTEKEKFKELIRLSKEQGYLTFDDINDSLPDAAVDPNEFERILMFLRDMNIEVIEASDVDSKGGRPKDPEESEEEDKSDQRADILDDPVRMYLKQMGQVPLLSREQEVEISKRIEDAELNVQRYVNRYGFVAAAHLDIARKLLPEDSDLRKGVLTNERFDRVIQDKKIEIGRAHV